MAKEMLINVSEGEECRIALLEKGKLEELYMERTSATSHVGNIYKGRVTNVEPSIQAAFVDFGLGRNGFLHISDLMPCYFGNKGEEFQESVGQKLSRRDRPPIQRCLRRGDEIVVQIIKEGIGTKGPTLSTYLSIPGRILVMMPGMSKFGVSRKIEDDTERRRLRQILDSLKPINEVGFIIRTAGVGKTKLEIQRDLNYLTRLWQNIAKKRDSGPGPMELYTEGDLVTRTVRDVFTSEIDRIIIDNAAVAKRVKEFIKIALPRTRNKVELYEQPVPLFHKYGIEKEIEMMNSRYVPLPSGGSLVIDSTEAIVAIDVNSGRFRDHNDAEMTAFKTDLEAADEIPRQLRMRDLGGVIICDFIDLRFERHRRELEKRIHDNLKNDRARTKVLRMSQFGIIEMTRQRMRPSLKRSIYTDCPHCKGAGLVKTPESMSLDVMRRLAIAAHDQRVFRIELAVCSDVAYYLQNRKRAQLVELESSSGKRIVIRVQQGLALDEMKLELHDARDGRVYMESLGMSPQDDQPQQVMPAGRQGGRRERRDRFGQRQRPPQRPVTKQHRPLSADDQFDIDTAEDAVEAREEEQEQVEEREPTEAVSAANVAAEVEPAPEPIEEDGEQQGEQRTSPTAQADEGEQPLTSGGRRRRRRGRRGRGGRGHGGNIAQAADAIRQSEPAASERAEAIHEPLDAETEAGSESPPQSAGDADIEEGEGNAAADSPADGEQPRRRRRHRGGRRHRRRRENQERRAQEVAGTATGTPPAATPTKAPVTPPAPVVRTGSTDKHLISDEPVLPQPLPRPRSYRDLDAIPDDLD